MNSRILFCLTLILDSLIYLKKNSLQGKRVYVTSNVKPSREVVIGLVLASSGQVIAIFSNILDIF